METPKLDFFLGRIREVKDRLTYEVTVDIPGVGEELKAYPYSRGEMDEPVPGNLVYLLSVDPMYHSVFLYLKAKENDFIGIRSNGKLIDITPEAITIGVYPEDDESRVPDDQRPDPETSYLKMDKDGNLEIMATGDDKINVSGSSEVEISGDSKVKISGSSEVEISGDSKIKVSGNVSIEVSGDCDLKVSGKATIDSPEVEITGGKLTTPNGGNAVANGVGGFCGLKNCLFTSAPHVTNEITNT